MSRLFMVTVAAVACVAAAQDGQVNAKKGPPPAFVRLLPDYEYSECQSYDTRDGEIWRKDGLRINWCDGFINPDMEDRKKSKDLEWCKEQVIGKTKFELTMMKGGDICISTDMSAVGVGGTTFHAKVKSMEELTDMMLIALSGGNRPEVKPK